MWDVVGVGLLLCIHGKLCALWKNSSMCGIKSYSQNHTDMTVNDLNGTWKFTGFYGHPESTSRRLSWSLLRQLANVDTLPWVCMGDFNDLLTNEEKKGGQSQAELDA